MNKGFSLVELIVVIAIMAILVGVAVPTYSAYIKKANKGVDDQLVADIEYAAKLANVEYGTSISITSSGDVLTVTCTDSDEGEAAVAAAQIAAIIADAEPTYTAGTNSFTVKLKTDDSNYSVSVG